MFSYWPFLTEFSPVCWTGKMFSYWDDLYTKASQRKQNQNALFMCTQTLPLKEPVLICSDFSTFLTVFDEEQKTKREKKRRHRVEMKILDFFYSMASSKWKSLMVSLPLNAIFLPPPNNLPTTTCTTSTEGWNCTFCNRFHLILLTFCNFEAFYFFKFVEAFEGVELFKAILSVRVVQGGFLG